MEALRLKELVEGSGAGALEVGFIYRKLAIPDYSPRPLPAGILPGLLVLMKFKPDLISSVLVTGVAVLPGLLSHAGASTGDRDDFARGA